MRELVLELLRTRKDESRHGSPDYTHLMRQIILLVVLASAAFAADTTYDGSRVHYESYGKGSDAVIFIHGWTCGGRMATFRVMAPNFDARDTAFYGNGRDQREDGGGCG